MSGPSGAHPLDDLAVYALDALDDPERLRIERHVATCPTCTAELDALRTTAAQLVRPVAPPSQVWERIATRLDFSPASNGDAAPVSGGRVHPLPARAQRPPRRWRARVLAAAAAVAVVAGALGFLSGRASDRTGSADVASLAQAALADPGNVEAALTDASGNEMARVVVGDGSGYVVLDHLARLPEGRAYQLWNLGGTSPVSLGVLGGGATPAVAVQLPHQGARLAITTETSGGATFPTGPEVAGGLLASSA